QPACAARQSEHRLLDHELDTGRDIRVPELQVGFRMPRRSEELLERSTEGARRVVIRQSAHVEMKATVFAQSDQLSHAIYIAWLAVPRHAHHLVFAFVHLEAEIRGECAV